MKAFLSFASPDRGVAEKIRMALLGAGQEVFFDEANLPPGGDYHSRIREAIAQCDAYIYLISPHSVGEGRYVHSELKFAKEKWPKPWGRVLPVVIAPTDHEQIDPYLAAVTLLTPKGDVGAEVAAAVAGFHSEASPIGGLIRERALQDPKLTQLPALFEVDHPLPLATAYVELRLAPFLATTPNPSLLETSLSLRERLNRKIEARYAVWRSPRDVIDETPPQATLILGSPGAGKSSLLRRLALDIAEGQWKHFKIPLFVEARIYWMVRKSGKDTDLLTHAIGNMLPLGEDSREALRELLQRQEEEPFVLLVDGLDEIASDPLGVNVVYEELRRFGGTVPWVVTSRPAGLMSSLGRVQRCEVVELDDDAIEVLIENWCAAMKGSLRELDAEHLKAEIFGVPGTLEMARNPFLLTALCFLKSLRPDNRLPLSRIEVYEELLRQIASQARYRYGQRSILAPNVLSGLQDFAYHLYDRPDGAIQIFAREHWWRFSRDHRDVGDGDFEDNILPARLLASFGEGDGQYHFLHLSLQEHLIARAMLNNSLDDALDRRFNPGWRSVFRFYGALLLQLGRSEEFRRLTLTLFKERDINNLSLLTLANIFADAGIRDTKDWIEEDLREELYLAAVSGTDAGPEAMIDALAALDPEWLEFSVREEMEEYLTNIENAIDNDGQEYEGNPFIVNGRGLDSPYEKLARARTGSAKGIIAEAFWGDNQGRALLAAYAYASVATPSERQVIIDKAASLSSEDEMALRIFAFAQALHRPEFVPFLGVLLDHHAEKADGPFNDCLNLIADIGGEQAAEILEKLSIREAGRISGDFNAFEVVLNAIVRMGGGKAARILEKQEKLPQLEEWSEAIRMARVEADPSREEQILEALADPALREEAIASLSRAADYQRIPSERVVRAILDHIAPDSLIGIMDLAFLESARLEAGEPPVLCGALLKIAHRLYDRLHDNEDQNDSDFLATQLALVFHALGKARWQASTDLIYTILENKAINEELMESVIELAGQVHAGTANDRVFGHLKEILFQDGGVHAHASAMAIGRIDLEELFRLRDTEMAMDALEEIAAESDLLIFEEFWVDRSGTKRHWQRPPRKILYAYDDEAPDIPQIFTHELSRYGFCLESVNAESCVAYLIFDDDEGYAKEMAEQARRLARGSGVKNPLIEVPKDLSEDEARGLAREIGGRLAGEYDRLEPPSLPV